MSVKLLVFDFDGVIVLTGQVHFRALNKALHHVDPKYCISEIEDFTYLGTKPTKDKLKIISQLKHLPAELHSWVLELKKQYTLDLISQMSVDEYFDQHTKSIIEGLRDSGFKIHLASNTNREFIDLVLDKIGIQFDHILCNQEIAQPKPHPEIYMRSMLAAGVTPQECLVFEDSITGQEAAVKSGAHVFPIEHPRDLNREAIDRRIGLINQQSTHIKWQSNRIQVVIPMAGEGSRFRDAGFTTPKPLIDVRGLPMVAAVIRDLNIDAQFIFIVKQEHEQQYNLSTMLKLMVPGCEICHVSGKQEGAATTILQIRPLIDNQNHLLIVNSDQMWSWQANTFYHYVTQSKLDGSIVVFEDPTKDPKWSFARLDENQLVVEVAEKQPISTLASAGIYYWSHGSDFVHYAEQMVAANDRINGEFYVAPVYNYAIRDSKRFNTFNIERFWPTGTPAELEYYLHNRKAI